MTAIYHLQSRRRLLLLVVPTLIAVLVMLFAFSGASAGLAMFGAPTGYPTNSTFNIPRAGALGDYNNDGNLDMMVSDGWQRSPEGLANTPSS